MQRTHVWGSMNYVCCLEARVLRTIRNIFGVFNGAPNYGNSQVDDQNVLDLPESEFTVQIGLS